MKYLLIAVMFWSYGAAGQVPDPSWEMRQYDGKTIWVNGQKIETVKCQHIYVAVEPDTVYESRGGTGGPSYGFGPRPTGKNIICVKCHYTTEQMISSKYPSGRSQIVPIDSLKMWLRYSPIKAGEGFKLFWHPGLRRLNSMYESLLFGSGYAPIGYNALPGSLVTEIIAGDCTGDCKKKK